MPTESTYLGQIVPTVYTVRDASAENRPCCPFTKTDLLLFTACAAASTAVGAVPCIGAESIATCLVEYHQFSWIEALLSPISLISEGVSGVVGTSACVFFKRSERIREQQTALNGLNYPIIQPAMT